MDKKDILNSVAGCEPVVLSTYEFSPHPLLPLYVRFIYQNPNIPQQATALFALGDQAVGSPQE